MDLHLGDPTTTTVPPSITSSSSSPHLSIRRRVILDPPPLPAPPRSPSPDELDREELGTLRHLTAELHSALRVSEEENAILKAKLKAADEWGLLEEEPAGLSSSTSSPTAKLDRLIEELRDIAAASSSDLNASSYVPVQTPFLP